MVAQVQRRAGGLSRSTPDSGRLLNSKRGRGQRCDREASGSVELSKQGHHWPTSAV